MHAVGRRATVICGYVSKATGNRGIHHLSGCSVILRTTRLTFCLANKLHADNHKQHKPYYIKRREHTHIRYILCSSDLHPILFACLCYSKHRLHDIKPYIYKIDDTICILYDTVPLLQRRACLRHGTIAAFWNRTLTTDMGHDQFLVLFRWCFFFYFFLL